jgi:hypothetical protein
MKMILNLLPETSVYTNNQLQEVHAGVIVGWRKLPIETQKHVASIETGIQPEMSDGAIFTTITVAWEIICNDRLVTTLKEERTFFLDVAFDVSGRSEQVFTKITYELLSKIGEDLSKNSKDFMRMFEQT